MIKKFNEYSNINKEEVEYDNLSNDSIIEIDGIEVDKNEWVIDEIIDVHCDNEDMKENAISLHSDLSSKPTKRGDFIWITALVRKNNTSFNNPSQQAVIKARIVDIYHGTSGLSHLNKALKKY